VPDNLDEQTLAVQEADSFVAMLHDYCGMGAAMRHVMTSALVNPQVTPANPIRWLLRFSNYHKRTLYEQSLF